MFYNCQIWIAIHIILKSLFNQFQTFVLIDNDLSYIGI